LMKSGGSSEISMIGMGFVDLDICWHGCVYYPSTSNGDARWIWWRILLRRARLQTASFDGSHALRALDQVRR